MSKRALARKVVRGVMFEIHLPDGQPEISLVSGKPRIEGPQLEGHAPKASLQAFLPNREVTGDRAVVEASIESNGKVTDTCRGTFVAVKEGHPAYHRW